MAGVAAMMVAAVSVSAQTQQDATNTADAQAQMAKMQAQVALQQAQLAPLQEKLVKKEAQLAPLREKLQTQMLPLEAKMDVMMAPLQAEMLARSAAMQAQMLARGAVMQAEMVGVGDPQVKDDLFAGTEKFAQGATNVTDVNLGPDMLGMVSGKHGGDVAHKLNFMVVRTYEYPRAGMYKMEDVEAYRQKLRTGNWNCFIHTHESETGESTDICNRALPNDEGNEMVILTVEPKELTFIHMSGKGSLADLGKLGALGHMHMGNLNIQGPKPPTPPAPPEPPAPAPNPHP
jgi:hypothetical protein